jgi:CubicO group peptidase (beta-lactamase class C family)
VDCKPARLMFYMLVSIAVFAACTTHALTPAISPNQTTPVALATSPVTDTLAASIDQYMQTQSVWSGTILVVQKGHVIISKGYGLADRENDVPNDAHTKFAIGSMTKAFTAMAIMMLQERGQLNVQDSICKYLSDCPNAWKPITLHQLLTHTSGIQNYTDSNLQILTSVTTCQEFTLEQALAILKLLPQDFPPGTKYSYSNSGYYLLGAVIEKVSGEAYDTFIQNNILLPLGMFETGYDRFNPIVKKRASGYSIDQNFNIINTPSMDVSQRYAAGGLYSTVGDLYKWDQALYTDQLVSKETLATIFTPMVPIPAGGSYGYGWIISQYAGHRLIWHGGKLSGFVSQITRFPDDQITIILLSNMDKEDTYQITNSLARRVLAENGG